MGLRFITIASLILTFSACVKKQQIKKEAEQQPQPKQVEQISQSETLLEQIPEIPSGEEGNVRRNIIGKLKTVYFDFDKYDLTPQAKETLSENAKIIIENNLNVIIEGHCDERGTNQYNLSLGQKRANAVRDYYMRLGVNPKNLATISYGEEMPVCFEKNEKCWSLNRRAETKVAE